ncbi:hypothetical protein LFLEISCH_05909 [Listeria fleischmannii subsp. fleischmannii LU2006-1]|nr:hypothetical protein LFLEISCH_05909 [Listeria fleischmannii subsp. fleischmannii LU2006-1]
MMVIAADLISAEMSSGTIKFLLTRPVSRARILTSKYISLLLSISAIIVLSGLTAYLISGPVFGYGGWGAPVLTGFQVSGDTIDTSNVYQLPIYQLLIMEFGLAWFVSIIVGILTIFVSVIVRQTAAVMGIMLAALITGTILTNLVNAWPSAKYLFMVNLQLTNYLNGTAPPVSGMTLEFSMLVLFIWGLTSCVLSYFIFTKQDISS